MADDVAARRRAKALFSYKPLYEADLAVRKGAVYEVVETVVPGQWWRVRSASARASEPEPPSPEEGNAPMAYFELLEDEAPVVEPSPAPSPPPIPSSTRPRPSPLADVLPSRPATSSPNPPFSVGADVASSPAASKLIPSAPRPDHAPAAAARPPARRPPPPSPRPSSSNSQGRTLPKASSSTAGERPEHLDEVEPVFTSLKERMAALNGRGLSVSRPSSAAAVQPAAGPAVRATATPPPQAPMTRPPPPPRKPSLAAPPNLGALSVSDAAPAPVAAQPASLRPPKLPPRLPPRRASSVASTESTSVASPVPSPGSVAIGALRKPPPVPVRRPSSTVPAENTASAPSNPPPPPRRQPNLAPPKAMPRPPPRPQTPPPLTFTLTVPSPQAQPIQEADLGLDSQWFYRQPLAFPDALLRIPYTSLAAGGEFSSGGGPSRLDVGILYGDRSRGFVTIEWGGGLSPLAPRVAQHQMAPPRPRTAGELAHAAEELGERVALWAEAREGTVVGRGECWDLADQALKEVSRALVDEGAAGGGLAEAVGIGFGEVVFVNVGGNVAWGPERRIRRGDVLQFVHATFKSYFSDGSSSTSTAGNPTTGHTAVVVEDWSGRGADPVRVLQANVGGSSLTRPGEFSLGDLVSGEVRAFRPMSSAWSGGGARPRP